MDDLISRQQAIDELVKMLSDCFYADEEVLDAVETTLKELPPAEPKRGKWIYHPEIGWGETWLCDQCGEKTTSTVMGKPRANFCPNCGADMRQREE